MQRIGRSLHGDLAFELGGLRADRSRKFACLGRWIGLGGERFKCEVV